MVGAALGAVGIDVDHLPGELGWDIITRGTGRPVTHSLATGAALFLLSRALPTPARAVLAGAASGVVAHLARDLGTGGLPLLWPASERRVRVPYGAYLTTLLVAGGGMWWRALPVMAGRRATQDGGIARACSSAWRCLFVAATLWDGCVRPTERIV